MKFLKKIIIMLLALLLMSVVSGCMNKHSKYKNIILNELEERYDKEFEMSSLYYEFNGNDFFYYRATCNAVGEEGDFYAYYYPHGYEFEEEAYLKEGYASLLLKNDDIARIKSYFDEDVLVFIDYNIDYGFDEISFEEYEKGVEYCLTSLDKDVYSHVCIILDNSIEDKEALENQTIDKVIFKDSDYALVHYVYVDKQDFDYMDKTYRDSFDYAISDLQNDDKVEMCIKYLYLGDDDPVMRSVIEKWR